MVARMVTSILVVVCMLSGSAYAGAQGSSEASQGAKALFVDSLSGAEISTASSPRPAAAGSGRKAKPSATARRTASPTSPSPSTSPTAQMASGIMYWVELVRPSGESVRVTTDRVFRSGERIRVHMMSNVDGDVAVYQRGENGRAVLLFPDRRVNDGTARVVKGATTMIPSGTSWFRFDDRPGIERITVLLTPRTGPMREDLNAGGATRLASSERQYDDLRAAGGSKDLILEIDTSGPEPASYAVRSSDTKDPVMIEIELKHEP